MTNNEFCAVSTQCHAQRLIAKRRLPSASVKRNEAMTFSRSAHAKQTTCQHPLPTTSFSNFCFFRLSDLEHPSAVPIVAAPTIMFDNIDFTQPSLWGKLPHAPPQL